MRQSHNFLIFSTMSQLSQKILAKIHSQKITPQSKWHFIVLHAVLWVCFIVTLAVGTLSVSLLLLEINMPERLYLEWMSESGSTNMLHYLPFIWAIGAILCLGVGYFVFSKTERGYRVSTFWLIGALILGSSIGWYALYKSNMAEIGEQGIRHFIPPYAQLRNDMHHWIPLPEDGFLPWKIESIFDNIYIIRSPDAKIWEIHLACIEAECRELQSTLKLEQHMLFIGKIREKQIFDATDIQLPPRLRCKQKWVCWGVVPPLLPPTEKSQED